MSAQRFGVLLQGAKRHNTAGRKAIRKRGGDQPPPTEAQRRSEAYQAPCQQHARVGRRRLGASVS
jgi:hypothetical protein